MKVEIVHESVKVKIVHDESRTLPGTWYIICVKSRIIVSVLFLLFSSHGDECRRVQLFFNIYVVLIMFILGHNHTISRIQ